jgi:hypothetical protein
MTGMRRRLALVLALVATIALAGCGVSATKKPTRLGDGLDAVGQPADQDDYTPPPGPTGIRDAESLVKAYLNASAGGGEVAATRVRQFLTQDARADWQPDQERPTVVRPLRFTHEPKSGGVTRVSVTVQSIGTLTDAGKIEPVAASQGPLIFDVVSAAGSNELLIKSAPPVVLLQESALRDYYQAISVYYWDKFSQVLVPDLRYISRAESVERRLSIAMDYLIDGPSTWLAQAVSSLRQGTKWKGPLVVDDPSTGGKLVNFSASAFSTDEEARKFMSQLRWTLASVLGKSVKLTLQIENVPRADVDGQSDDYLADNGANTLPRTAPLYVVHPTGADKDRVVAESTEQPFILKDSEANHNVVTAAVNRDASAAAFVRRSGNHLSLSVTSLNESKDDTNSVLVDIGSPTSISRPTWLYQTDQALVAANGSVLSINRNGVSHTLSLLGVSGVTHVVAAPDGRRVALLAGGRVYVAPVIINSSNVSVLSAKPVTADLTATGVVWASENKLLVMGTSTAGVTSQLLSTDGSAAALSRLPSQPGEEPLKLDNAQSAQLQNLTDLSTVPTTPFDPNGIGWVYAQAKGQIYQYYPGTGSISALDDKSVAFYAN